MCHKSKGWPSGMTRHNLLFELFAEQCKEIYPFHVSTPQPRCLAVEAAVSSHPYSPSGEVALNFISLPMKPQAILGLHVSCVLSARLL